MPRQRCLQDAPVSGQVEVRRRFKGAAHGAQQERRRCADVDRTECLVRLGGGAVDDSDHIYVVQPLELREQAYGQCTRESVTSAHFHTAVKSTVTQR